MYAASQAGHHKVYIVDEAHMLTREAWNALLKILEEPPPGVVFVFATTEPPEDRATGGAGALATAAIRFPADRSRGDPRAAPRRFSPPRRSQADEDALTLIARQADGGMRDALSVLDQCLSFGEGAITAARVREVLGLVTDEAYADLLALIAARNPAGVFPLVDRLADGGADLIEFMGGAAEVLRAVLLTQLGGRSGGDHRGHAARGAQRCAIGSPPETAPDAEAVRRDRAVTRSERNSAARRGDGAASLGADGSDGGAGGSTRWRTGRSGRTGRSRRTGVGRTRSKRGRRSPASARPRSLVAPPARPPRPPRPSPIALSDLSAEFTLAGLTDAWPHLMAAARQQSRFLGEALATATITEVAPPVVWLAAEGNPTLAEGLQHQLKAVEGLIGKLRRGFRAGPYGGRKRDGRAPRKAPARRGRPGQNGSGSCGPRTLPSKPPPRA